MRKPAYSSQLAGGRSPVTSFKELVVWQRAMELAKEVYKITAKLPVTEQYGLASQMRRCAVSIPSNIAEGKRRSTTRDFVQFLRIADGSASELETQLLLASELYSIQSKTAFALLNEVQRMLGGMFKGLLPTVSRKLSTRNSYA